VRASQDNVGACLCDLLSPWPFGGSGTGLSSLHAREKGHHSEETARAIKPDDRRRQKAATVKISQHNAET